MKPWAVGPFELINHAEQHRKAGNDFDRRMALISYDNAIEASIITFLRLNPKQRSNIEFQRAKVEDWLSNYHTKLAFFYEFLTTHKQGEPVLVEHDEVLYYHMLRNELYHDGRGQVPTLTIIEGAREAALWIFCSLFGGKPDELLVPSAEKPTPSTPTQPSTTPESNLVGMLIDIKKALNDLRHLDNNLENKSVDQAKIVEQLLSSTPQSVKEPMLNAFKRADAIKNTLVDKQLADVGDDDLAKIQRGLAELKEVIGEKLRSHQSELAQAAFIATQKAVLEKQFSIGIIHQVTGSGLSMTLAGYLQLILRSTRLSNFHILVVFDRLTLLDQTRRRIADLVEKSGRQLLQPTQGEFLNQISNGPPAVLILTAQALARWSVGLKLAENILLIGFDAQKSVSRIQAAITCFNIHFSSTLTGPEFELIGNYPLERAVTEGYLINVQIEKRVVPPGTMVGLDEEVGLIGSRNRFIGSVARYSERSSYPLRSGTVSIRQQSARDLRFRC